MNYIKRYIPSRVYDEIQKLEFKNKEHLYIICDMISRVTIFKKEDTDYSNTFTDIPNYYFRDIITKYKSFDDAFSVLKSHYIILCDNIYSKQGGKALGYKFNDNMISELIPVELHSKPLSKQIINNKNERNNLVADKYKTYRDHFVTTFGIDYTEALKYINGLMEESISTLSLNTPLCSDFFNKEWIKIVNKYNHLFMSINAINDGELFFRKNKTNGRVDTNLTNMKGELKKFITVPNLYQIDIINSQPFILSLLLNTPLCSDFLDKKELEKYTNWTSAGIFYEMFTREYFNKTSKLITRKDIKDIMFCIFYSKNVSYRKEKNIFSDMFPTIMKYIEQQKINKHNEFAIKLQKIESKICIDIICEELHKENIKYYTIHDAWLVDLKDVEATEKIIHRMFYKNFYRRPELKIEKITN